MGPEQENECPTFVPECLPQSRSWYRTGFNGYRGELEGHDGDEMKSIMKSMMKLLLTPLLTIDFIIDLTVLSIKALFFEYPGSNPYFIDDIASSNHKKGLP